VIFFSFKKNDYFRRENGTVKIVTMTKEEKVKYWMDLSDDDLAVAHTMLVNKHYSNFCTHGQ
jgi:hypothetical protein